MKRLLVFGFLIIGFAAVAQPYTSRLGRFQVDQVRGCAPFTINITNTNLSGNGGCTSGTPCVMSFDGTNNCPPNSTCQNVIQFTYNTPGTYKLAVTYQNTGADDITITVDQNIQPAFDIYSCAGDKVMINITDKNYDSYNIDFNSDGTNDKSIPSGNNQTALFAYAAAGNYNISVKGQKLNAANNCTAKVQSFTAIAALPLPTINSLTATDASTLQLAFTPKTNIEYKSEIAFNNAANFQTYQTLYGVNSMTASNLNVNGSYYCFRLSSYDPCANANTYSVPICSHNFNLNLTSGSDQLSWQTSSSGITNIQIKRDNNTLATVAPSVTSYNDNAVVCKTNYCYQLVSNYASATSTSLQKCGIAFSNIAPTPINNTSAVVNGSQVDLTWVQPSGFVTTNYQVMREPLGGTFALQNTVTSTSYTDDQYGSGGYCYQINYTDQCDNNSAASLTSCPMRLSGSLDAANNANLNWSGYKGWNQGVKTYIVQKYFQQGQTPQTIYSGPDSTFTDTQQDLVNQVAYYKITATANETGVTQSVSNEIRIVKKVNLFYPTAFNPESKAAAVNRTFLVRGHYIASMTFQVFDRWGSLVFYSDKDEAWDGRRDGMPMPDATYVWTAEGTDLVGNQFKKAGVIVLIRK